MTSRASQKIRELNCFETFTDACMVHRNLSIAHAVTLNSQTKIQFHHVEKALKLLQKKNIQLGACIKRCEEQIDATWLNPLNWLTGGTKNTITKSEFWTIQNPTVPLQWIKLTTESNWFKDILESGIQVTFEEGELLWRALWVEYDHGPHPKNPTFILICHPAIADGRGTLLLIEEFLAKLDTVLQIKPDDQETNVVAEMHLNAEKSFDSEDIKVNWGDVWSIYKFFGSCLLWPWKSPYIAQNPVPLIPDYTTRHIPFNLTKQQSSAILRELKERNLSLHSLITAAASVAMHNILKLPKHQRVKFMTTHEADLRLFCNQELQSGRDRLHGEWCTYIEEPVETTELENPTDFWNFVAHSHNSIVNKLNSNFTVKMAVYCFANDKMGSPYKMFSNLGINTTTRNDFGVAVYQDLDDLFRDTENFQIEDIYGTIAAFAMGSPFKHVVHIYKGRINYTMTYFGNYVTRDQAKEFGQKTLDIMINICSKSN